MVRLTVREPWLAADCDELVRNLRHRVLDAVIDRVAAEFAGLDEPGPVGSLRVHLRLDDSAVLAPALSAVTTFGAANDSAGLPERHSFATDLTIHQAVSRAVQEALTVPRYRPGTIGTGDDAGNDHRWPADLMAGSGTAAAPARDEHLRPAVARVLLRAYESGRLETVLGLAAGSRARWLHLIAGPALADTGVAEVTPPGALRWFTTASRIALGRSGSLLDPSIQDAATRELARQPDGGVPLLRLARVATNRPESLEPDTHRETSAQPPTASISPPAPDALARKDISRSARSPDPDSSSGQPTDPTSAPAPGLNPAAGPDPDPRSNTAPNPALGRVRELAPEPAPQGARGFADGDPRGHPAGRNQPSAPQATGGEAPSAMPVAGSERPIPRPGAVQPTPQLKPLSEEIGVPTILPFLVVGALSRLGILDTVAAALVANALEHYLSTIAAALTRKLVPPPDDGWWPAPGTAEALSAMLGGVPEPDGASAGHLAHLAPKWWPLVGADLVSQLATGRTEKSSLLVATSPSGLVIAEGEGVFPLVWDGTADDVERLRDLFAPAPVEHDPPAPLTELVDELDSRPAAGRHGFAEALDPPVNLLAATGLAVLAWDLWSATERTHPLLALHRFADLDGRVRLRAGELRVQLPMGRRSSDLSAAGLLDPITGVPWLPGCRIEFSTG